MLLLFIINCWLTETKAFQGNILIFMVALVKQGLLTSVQNSNGTQSFAQPKHKIILPQYECASHRCIT